MNSDFIFTIESDDEAAAPPPPAAASAAAASSSKRPAASKKRRAVDVDAEAQVDSGFTFDAFGGGSPPPTLGSSRRKAELDEQEVLRSFKRPNAPPRVKVDDIIARRRREVQEEEVGEGDEGRIGVGDWEGFSDESEDEPDEDGLGSDQAVSDGVGSEEDVSDIDAGGSVEDGAGEAASPDTPPPVTEMTEEEQEAKAYFDQATMPFDLATAEELSKDSHDRPFSSLPGAATLSRPILLGLSSMSLTTPTPVQRQTVPLALLGRDLVCSSVTGSGKTVGYLVPALERLHLGRHHHQRQQDARTRVLVLVPTRELAVQVHAVAVQLARFTGITAALCVGGVNVRAQEAALRARPDVVVATPGRLIDHVRNAKGFTLDALEILVIDEADRILDEGFHDELQQIVAACPARRQTLLFSATVTERVADLARLSLDKPVRVKIDPPKAAAAGLTQEFLRIRREPPSSAAPDADPHREAVLVAVCTKAFTNGRTIVFFRSKKGAHRMKVLFSLCGLASEELHGDLTQEQRLEALAKFKAGETGFLLATDLASRGLDIKGVDDVINYDAPRTYEIYLHRIGRTARAGRKGTALTFAGERDRKLVKEAKRHAGAPLKQRRVPPAVVDRVAARLARLEPEVASVLAQEADEREIRRTEMELAKGRNMLEHEAEIASRPPRTWFQSEREKKQAARRQATDHVVAAAGVKRDRFAGMSRAQKRRKLANDEDARDSSARRAMDAGIRAAKKSLRPGKIGDKTAGGGGGGGSFQRQVRARKAERKQQKQEKKKKGSGGPGLKKAKSSFAVELGKKGGKKQRR